MNNKYNNLDQLLIAAIKSGTCTTGEMERNQSILAETTQIIAPDVKNIFRVIDGRLQHLPLLNILMRSPLPLGLIPGGHIRPAIG